MTTYNVLDNRRHIVGTYPEYDKFARYNGGCNTWIPLLIGENRVRFFALSTLEAARVPFMTDMEFTCAEPPPLQGCELPPPMCIFPMPLIHTKVVFLALANYVLYLEMSKVDPRKAQPSAKQLVNAESDSMMERKAAA